MIASPGLPSWIPRRLRLPFGSVRAQLILWNVMSIALLLGGLGLASRFVTLSFMMQSVDRELERGVERFRRPPRGGPPPGGEQRPPPGAMEPGPGGPDSGMGPMVPMGRIGAPNQGQGPERGSHGPGDPVPGRRPPAPPDANNPWRPHVFNAEGKSDWPGDKRAVWDHAGLARALRGEMVFTNKSIDDEPYRVISAPGFDHMRRKGAVQYAYPLKDVYLAVSGIDTALWLLLPVCLVGAGWMGSALTNRILRRVQWMTQAAGSIGARDFAKRLPAVGNDEFAEMANTFNGLLTRLETAYEEQARSLELQKRFTADASHELKTPLTIVKGTTSLALSKNSVGEGARKTLTEIDKAADTMNQLVQDLLLLARSDAGQMGRDSIEILAREVLETAKSQSRQPGHAQVRILVEPDDLTLRGNETELVRVFRNLLDNALRYTPADGCVTLHAHRSDGQVEITVQDTGSGIAAEHLPHLGERFYRVDAARSRPGGGTGLGLSICKSIVEAHGGRMEIESEVGHGTTVRVTLSEHRIARPSI